MKNTSYSNNEIPNDYGLELGKVLQAKHHLGPKSVPHGNSSIREEIDRLVGVDKRVVPHRLQKAIVNSFGDVGKDDASKIKNGVIVDVPTILYTPKS